MCLKVIYLLVIGDMAFHLFPKLIQPIGVNLKKMLNKLFIHQSQPLFPDKIFTLNLSPKMTRFVTMVLV